MLKIQEIFVLTQTVRPKTNGKVLCIVYFDYVVWSRQKMA